MIPHCLVFIFCSFFFFSYYRIAYVLLGHCCFCLINLKALSSQHKACLDDDCNNLLLELVAESSVFTGW